MNRHIKLAVCTMIWLTGVAMLVSCTTSPRPETPSQEEQASRSSREPMRLAQQRALRAGILEETAQGAAADYAVSPAGRLSGYGPPEERVPAWDTILPGSEIWVIARSSAVPPVGEDAGSGTMVANIAPDDDLDGAEEIPLSASVLQTPYWTWSRLTSPKL